MKQISIDKEQRQKLIEICRELFPEYSNVNWGRLYEGNYIWFDSIPNPKPDPYEVHWFELCMTEVPIRLHKVLHDNLNRSTAGVIDKNKIEEMNEKYEPELLPLDVLDLLIMGNEHPVDTIWKEFLKLKLWNIHVSKT